MAVNCQSCFWSAGNASIWCATPSASRRANPVLNSLPTWRSIAAAYLLSTLLVTRTRVGSGRNGVAAARSPDTLGDGASEICALPRWIGPSNAADAIIDDIMPIFEDFRRIVRIIAHIAAVLAGSRSRHCPGRRSAGSSMGP